MKSIKKILTAVASTCVVLSSCNIDPELTSSYPSDVIWENDANLSTYINGYYGCVGGYYGLGTEASTDMLKLTTLLITSTCLSLVTCLSRPPVICLVAGATILPYCL